MVFIWIAVTGILSAIIATNQELKIIQNKMRTVLWMSIMFFLINGLIITFSKRLDNISVRSLLTLCGIDLCLVFGKKNCLWKKDTVKPECISSKMWIAVTPIIIFFLMEGISNPDLFNVMELKYKIANIVILGIVFVFIYYVCFPCRLTIAAFYIFTVLFSIVNYCVGVIRNGNAILPSEIAAARTAMNVASGYDLDIPERILALIFIAVVCCGISFYAVKKSQSKLKGKSRVILGCLLVTFSIWGYRNIDLTKGYYNVQLDYWKIINAYHTYGTPVTFISLCQAVRVQEPLDYNKEYVAKIYNEYETGTNENDEKQKPTVIAIMNETWSDLNIIRQFECNPDYMSFWHNFDEPLMKGNLLVPVYGGGTCNTEFEFLTGMSMGNLPHGAYPYQQYSLKNVSSLAREFKKSGYDTVAIHPGNPASWNRKNALLNLGFDKFYSKDDFENPEYIRYFVSDQSCYDKIIEEFENKEREKFIFAVTIQNHGSYDYLPFPEDEQVQLEADLNSYSDAREYMTLIKKADEAMAELFAYFEKVEEPVIICIFGDHQPFLNDEFYEKLYGHSLNELSFEEKERKYITPYLIWANYDTGMTQSRENTSANFLGALLLDTAGIMDNPFYRYIFSMQQEVIAMNPDYYRTKDGIQHSTSDCDNEWLKKYQILQYYEMFNK